MLELRN